MQQIRLDNDAFEGNNNAYLLAGPEGPTTLIDTGIDAPEVEANLRDRLDAEGLAFADVEQIFLTHFHLDHSGLAGRIQHESGCPVYVHADDIGLIGDSDEARNALLRDYGEGIADWNIPTDKHEEVLSHLERARRVAGRPIDATPLDLERTYATAGGELTPVYLPGHTLGHVGYELPNGELIAGDAILPVYTPNIGGADPRVPAPLETYLDTLSEIVRRDPPCVWPGHRDRIDDPAARAHEIRDHHRDRTARIVGMLGERGPMEVWELAIALFGSLSGIHILHGPGEAFAHLDHLVDEGIVTESDGAYELVIEQVDHDAVVPTLG